MSPLMNMTLFSLFPGSERPHSIGCDAQTVTIRSTMKKKKQMQCFCFERGTECTLVWVMEQLQATIKAAEQSKHTVLSLG